MVNKISVNLVRNKVMIQISKLIRKQKQTKYDQNVKTVLRIKQKHGLKQRTKANTKTTKTKTKT
jgi:hypothetical protein